MKKNERKEKHAIGSEAAAKKRTMFHGNEKKSAEVENTQLDRKQLRRNGQCSTEMNKISENRRHSIKLKAAPMDRKMFR